MKILFAADGSAYTDRALDHLDAYGPFRGADLTVLHVVPPITHHAASFLAPDVVAGYYRDEAERMFAPVRDRLAAAGVAARFEAGHGHAAEVIAAHANAGAFDLLVMGSHGHGNLGNLVLGSVATQVVSATCCPVLMVR